ncbi:MAG TPA: hypothetical protein VIQ30_10040 [Pseudonocardia sp.]
MNANRPTATTGYRHVATFCSSCNCGCPELFVDESAPTEQRIVITDDFGQRIQMSIEQLNDLVTDIKGGVLDALLVPAGA